MALTAVAVAAALAAATARFRLEIGASGIVLSNRCLGIPYRWQRLPLDVRVTLYEPYEAPAEGVLLSKDELGREGVIVGSRHNCRELAEVVKAAIARRLRG